MCSPMRKSAVISPSDAGVGRREAAVVRQHGRGSQQDDADRPVGDVQGVALDRLRSSALIHQAALQLPGLPAGTDPPAFDASRPHQRCEHRCAYARVARGGAQEQPSRLQVGSTTSVTPAPEVTVNFMTRF